MSERPVFFRRPQPLRGHQRRDEVNAQVARVAPSPPPCFDDQGVWVVVLQGVQSSPKHQPERKPLTPEGKFNFMGVDFCGACPTEHKARMRHLCRPDWFKDEDEVA